MTAAPTVSIFQRYWLNLKMLKKKKKLLQLFCLVFSLLNKIYISFNWKSNETYIHSSKLLLSVSSVVKKKWIQAIFLLIMSTQEWRTRACRIPRRAWNVPRKHLISLSRNISFLSVWQIKTRAASQQRLTYYKAGRKTKLKLFPRERNVCCISFFFGCVCKRIKISLVNYKKE